VYGSSVVSHSAYDCGCPNWREFFSVCFPLFSWLYRYHPCFSRHHPVFPTIVLNMMEKPGEKRFLSGDNGF
jgi:hypothetical protein